MKRTTLAAAIAAATLTLAAYHFSGDRQVWADDLQATVDARRALMKEIGGNVKAIADALDAKSTDTAAMAQHAETIQADAAKIPDLFPAGTSADEMPGKTHAKPDIWQHMDTFKADAATLGTEAGKLADAAKSGDTTAVAAALDSTGKNACGACHKQFRLPLQ